MKTKNNKIIQKIIFLFFLFIMSCKSTGLVVHDATTKATSYINRTFIGSQLPLQLFRKQGFRYKIPDGMVESPGEAYRYKYDNLILDKGSDYYSSGIVIAIRHYDLKNNEELKSFTKMDQSYLQKSVNPTFDNSWKPEALHKNNIEHQSYQFHYKMQKTKIYQQSVYVLCEETVHIISISSLYKELLTRKESKDFWQSVRID